MSQPQENEPRRRDQLRRVLSRFTTTFRRGGVLDEVADPDLSSPALPVVASQDEAGSSIPSLLDVSNMIIVDDQNMTPQSPSVAPSIRTGPRSRQNSTLSTRTCMTVDRAAAHDERAQRMLKRYGVDISPYDRQISSHLPSTVSRVAKAPRMRINRSCHQCGLEIGSLTQCIGCEHRTCKQCPRVAGRKVRTALQEAMEDERMSIDPIRPTPGLPETRSVSSVNTTVVLEIDEDEHEQTHEDYPFPSSERIEHSTTDVEQLMSQPLISLEVDDDTALTSPPPFPGRTMRSTANTQTEPLEAASSPPFMFSLPTTNQRNNLQPEFYPSAQRVYRKARQRVRYTCHECETANEQHTRRCSNCGHERCDLCRRKPSVRTAQQPDKRVVEAVEQRLASMS